MKTQTIEEAYPHLCGKYRNNLGKIKNSLIYPEKETCKSYIKKSKVVNCNCGECF
ncbi:MAG: hypothetical protein KJI69_05080 [Patescibacteria group bacterium]|nr:hypothetical protein [Patescibacteria group bacterium]